MKTRTTTRRLVAGAILSLIIVAAGCDESSYSVRTHSGQSPYARNAYSSTTYRTAGRGSIVEVYEGYPRTTTDRYWTTASDEDRAAVIWYPNTTARVHYNSRRSTCTDRHCGNTGHGHASRAAQRCGICNQTYTGRNHQCQTRRDTTRRCGVCNQTYTGRNHRCQTQLPTCVYCGRRHNAGDRACIRDGHGQVVVVPSNTRRSQRTLTRGELAELRRREAEVARYEKQVAERNEWIRKQNAKNAARRR